MAQDEDKKILINKMLNADIDKIDIHMDANDPALAKPLIKISIYFKGIKEHLEYQLEIYDIKLSEIDTVLDTLGFLVKGNKIFHKY